MQERVVLDNLDKSGRRGKEHQDQNQNESHEHIKKYVELFLLLAINPVDVLWVDEETNLEFRCPIELVFGPSNQPPELGKVARSAKPTSPSIV